MRHSSMENNAFESLLVDVHRHTTTRPPKELHQHNCTCLEVAPTKHHSIN